MWKRTFSEPRPHAGIPREPSRPAHRADHTAFDDAAIVKHGRLVVDSRDATKNVKGGREKIRKV